MIESERERESEREIESERERERVCVIERGEQHDSALVVVAELQETVRNQHVEPATRGDSSE